MDTDDLDPKNAPAGKPDLYVMSIEQLNEYIAEMEIEIARVRTEIARKQSARGDADSVFKS